MEKLEPSQIKRVVPIPSDPFHTIALLSQELETRFKTHNPVEIGFDNCEADFHSILDVLPIPAAITQCSSGTILYANHRLGATFGCAAVDLIGRPATDFYARPAERQQLLHALTQHGYLRTYKIQAKQVNGTCFWTEISLQLLCVKGDRLILSTFQEIAADPAIAVQPQVRSLEQAFQEQQRALTTLLGNLPGMAYRCQNDPNWTMEFVSEGCFDLTGYTPAALIGNHKVAYAQLIHPDDQERVWEQVQLALRERKPFQLMYRISTAAGEEKSVWEQGCGIFSQAGKLLALEGFITDISERKRAEEESALLQQIVQAIDRAPDFHAALEATLGLVCEAIGWDFGEAWIPRADDTVMNCIPVWYASDRRPAQIEAKSPGLTRQPVLSAMPLSEFHRLSKIFTFSPGAGLVGRVWQAQQPEWIQDVSTSSAQRFYRTQIAKSSGLRAGFAVPMLADGQVLAVLVFFMFEARREDKRLVELVTAVATQLGSVLQRKQVQEALRLAEEKYRSIFENAIEGIFQTTPEGRYLSANPALARIYGYDSPEQLIADLTDISHQLYIDPNRRLEFIRLMQTHDAVSAFESQIYQRDGTAIWIVENARVVRDAQNKPLYYEGTVEDITERKQLEARLLYDALHDTLTGLANRALFVDRLQQAMRQLQRCDRYLFAVLYLDLDRFKAINDSLGHGAGDRFLIEISQRLEGCVRPQDTVARMGGDEFAILLDDVNEGQHAIAVADRLQQTISQPFVLEGHEVFTTASIGITLSTIGRQEPGDFLRDADTAMYRAKELGKARYEIFEATMHTRAIAWLQLESDLRRAIEHHEFRLYYQPVVSLETNQIAGFEALLRWQHPDRGLLNPKEFIPLAEETGSIVPLGWWVLREACYQLRDWQAQFPREKPLTLNVNLSGQQFSQPDLIEQVQTILQETGVDASSLRLEITESQIVSKAEAATTMLQQLRDLQIQLCIDDFGTGYSSLSYLHRFPTHLLKIDRSFVTRMGFDSTSTEIVRTIVVLAHNLGMDAIAEGVETADQLTQLRDLHCKFGQGYLFARPLPREAATAVLAGSRSRCSAGAPVSHDDRSTYD